jgi:GNAT superfamily N-acetyltransferase
LEDLFVKEECRGKGVGKVGLYIVAHSQSHIDIYNLYSQALLKHLARTAVAKECKRMDWQALDWNKPAIDFYTSIGAKAMNEWLNFRLTGDALTSFAAEP